MRRFHFLKKKKKTVSDVSEKMEEMDHVSPKKEGRNRLDSEKPSP
jgi:hypothetical protein